MNDTIIPLTATFASNNTVTTMNEARALVVSDTLTHSSYTTGCNNDLQSTLLVSLLPAIRSVQSEQDASTGNGANMLSVISESKAVQPSQAPCDILIVEDNTAVREVLREVLHEEGYNVHAVIHGQDALDYLSDADKLPRVILLDLMMPIMTGWEFRALQRDHECLQNIPVIVLTAVASDISQQRLACLNAAALLSKPIDWVKLLNTIAQIAPSSNANVIGQMSNILPAQQYQHTFALAQR